MSKTRNRVRHIDFVLDELRELLLYRRLRPENQTGRSQSDINSIPKLHSLLA